VKSGFKSLSGKGKAIERTPPKHLPYSSSPPVYSKTLRANMNLHATHTTHVLVECFVSDFSTIVDDITITRKSNAKPSSRITKDTLALSIYCRSEKASLLPFGDRATTFVLSWLYETALDSQQSGVPFAFAIFGSGPDRGSSIGEWILKG
jgi:hypothetical protein